jgi:hypothetical protein
MSESNSIFTDISYQSFVGSGTLKAESSKHVLQKKDIMHVNYYVYCSVHGHIFVPGFSVQILRYGRFHFFKKLRTVYCTWYRYISSLRYSKRAHARKVLEARSSEEI